MVLYGLFSIPECYLLVGNASVLDLTFSLVGAVGRAGAVCWNCAVLPVLLHVPAPNGASGSAREEVSVCAPSTVCVGQLPESCLHFSCAVAV